MFALIYRGSRRWQAVMNTVSFSPRGRGGGGAHDVMMMIALLFAVDKA